MDITYYYVSSFICLQFPVDSDKLNLLRLKNESGEFCLISILSDAYFTASFYMSLVTIGNLYTYNWIVKSKAKKSPNRTKPVFMNDLIETFSFCNVMNQVTKRKKKYNGIAS